MQSGFRNPGSLIRVLIVADSTVMRAGLEALLADSPDLEVLSGSARGEITGQLIAQLQPEVVLLEGADGDQDLVLTATPDAEIPAIVVLLDDGQQAPVVNLIRSGVRGVLPLEATASEIVQAVHAAAAGLITIHPDLLEGVLSTNRFTPEEPEQPLTSREVEVLKMLAEGLGNKAIARRLNISEHTVKFHIGSIFSKLNASSRTEAVILGARQGLVLL
jgi:DNA-binding NarL/FixJ family response regulator